MAIRYSLHDEMSVVLGSFANEEVTLAHPRILGETYEQYVFAHEGAHKFLTLGTLFGFFQRWTSTLLNRLDHSEAGENLRLEFSRIAPHAIDISSVTHEAAASYIELCVCADLGNSVEDHFRTLPKRYIEVITHLQSCIGIPEKHSALIPYQWLVAMLLAKLALNNGLLREFADPKRLSYDRFREFHKQHSPDARFIYLCEALAKKGGLDSILSGLSEELAIAWANMFAEPPVFAEHSNSQTILDMRPIGGIGTNVGLLMGEHAEWPIMRLLRAALPGIETYVGSEEMNVESEIFADGWRELVKAHANMNLDRITFTGPGDPVGKTRDRKYAVRFRLNARLDEVMLDDLRAFLNEGTRKGLFTVVGFIETIYEEVAVFAVSFGGFDTLDSQAGTGAMSVQQTMVGVMPIVQILDFALLHWEQEPYSNCTGWHLPLEVINKYGFPNVAVGLHGAVLRSIPNYNEAYLKTIIDGLLKQNFEVYVRYLRLVGQHSGVILIQTLNDNIEWIRRLPGSPSFVVCLGLPMEFESLKEHCAREQHNASNLHWGAPADDQHLSLVLLLLEAAYNFDQFAGHFLPGELIADFDVNL